VERALGAGHLPLATWRRAQAGAALDELADGADRSGVDEVSLRQGLDEPLLDAIGVWNDDQRGPTSGRGSTLAMGLTCAGDDSVLERER
jgi:hypothetical protein